MKTKAGKAAFCLIAIVLFMSSGCAGGKSQSQQNQAKPAPVGMRIAVDQTPARQAEKKGKQVKNVTASVAVNSKKDLMVGIKLKTFARFNTLQIVNHLQKSLQKQYPKMKVQVSSDKKIYAEISDAKKKMKQGKLTSSKLKKKMKRIHRFMKDQDPSKQ